MLCFVFSITRLRYICQAFIRMFTKTSDDAFFVSRLTIGSDGWQQLNRIKVDVSNLDEISTTADLIQSCLTATLMRACVKQISVTCRDELNALASIHTVVSSYREGNRESLPWQCKGRNRQQAAYQSLSLWVVMTRDQHDHVKRKDINKQKNGLAV